jgi:hypothetical protein
MEDQEINVEWGILFAGHKTKVLGFDIDDLLRIKLYLDINDLTPFDLDTGN